MHSSNSSSSRQAGNEPFLLVLDEIPYLLESVRGFGTIVQKQWDHALQKTQIKLVLSGSYISAMTRLTAADQPLHGRRTGDSTLLRSAMLSRLPLCRSTPQVIG